MLYMPKNLLKYSFQKLLMAQHNAENSKKKIIMSVLRYLHSIKPRIIEADQTS